MDEIEAETPQRTPRKLTIAILLTILVVGVVAVGFFYNRTPNEVSISQEAPAKFELASHEERTALAAAVWRLLRDTRPAGKPGETLAPWALLELSENEVTSTEHFRRLALRLQRFPGEVNILMSEGAETPKGPDLARAAYRLLVMLERSEALYVKVSKEPKEGAPQKVVSAE